MVRLDLIEVELPEVPASFDGNRRYMVVANHPSLIDVVLIKATLPGVVCLVKSSVFHAPHVSGMLQGTGDFPGPSGKPEIGTTQVLDLLVEKLKSGLNVLTFPEGTRSPPGGLRRFRRGACEAAIRAGATILPICITCDPPAFLKGQSWFAQDPKTPRLTLRFLDEIATEGRTSPELTRELRTLFASELGL